MSNTMKYRPLFLLAISVTLLAKTFSVHAVLDLKTETKDNSDFWARFAREDIELSIHLNPSLSPISPTNEAYQSSFPPPPPIDRKPCRINVDMDCITTKGLPCEELISPPSDCTDDDGLLSLSLQYLNSTCNESTDVQGNKSFCVDFKTISSNYGKIQCITDTGVKLNVTPSILSFGSFFTIMSENGEKLSAQTDCTLINEKNVKVQQFVIDTSGDRPLRPGDRFGSVMLETCGTRTCIDTIVYTIEFLNLASKSVKLKRVDFTSLSQTMSLLDYLESNLLKSYGMATVKTSRDINFCKAERLFATVEVEAEANIIENCEIVYSEPA